MEYEDEEFEVEEPEDNGDSGDGDGEDRRLADGDSEAAEENNPEEETL